MQYLYYNMNCEVTIGKVVFDRVNSITIMSSIKKLADTATIVVPRAFNRATIAGKPGSLEKRNITEYIKVDDPVSIKLGYDGNLEEEFSGYITKIGADIPLKIECMDEMTLLKKNNFTRTFASASLMELLNYIAPEYTHEVIDDVNLQKFTINNKSGFQVLELLRKNYGLHSYFKDKVLHVGFPISLIPTQNHRFVLNKNVRAKSNNLKFVKKEDVKLLLKAISINTDGGRIFSEFGDKGGAQRTLHFSNKTLEELKNLAEKNYKSLSFDGYQGNIPGWGIPRTKPGDAIEITAPKYSERDGRYLIEGVTIKFNGSDGFLRENKLSLKL
ncbi:hypothetical protein [Aquimarina algiphila]|uniref:Phage late control D family protein n=1 Tax=Aquimarina algiphila TaxID=2047982 RepID=A0A554VEW1_9FLAO|nr:hypothetical protein [Aquimarina algiphila]TSE05672.1 hypothetical protein FOF46_21835 [Aquimarina algiphila]